MAAPVPFMKIFHHNKLCFEYCNPHTGVLTRWFHNTTNHMLGGEDVNAFEKSKDVAILIGSFMMYIPPHLYESMRMMFPSNKDLKIHAMSMRMMFVGAMRAVEVEKEEETFIEDRIVWEYKDFHNASDIFAGSQILVQKVSVPCPSPFMIYAILAKFHPPQVSMEHIGLQVPGYWEFIDWVVGFMDPDRCTMENVLKHIKAFSLDTDRSVHEKIADELANTDSQMLRRAKNDPKQPFDLQFLSGITHETFVKMRGNHYDCTAPYLARMDHMILVRAFGMLVCERLTLSELDVLKDHIEAHLCGLFSYQYMLNLLRNTCNNNSAFEAIMAAYENTYTTFNVFNANAILMYNYVRDLYAEERLEVPMQQKQKENEMVAVAYALMQPDVTEFREKLFLTERYGGGKVIRLTLVSGQDNGENGFYDEENKFTGITKTIAKNLQRDSIYMFVEDTSDGGDSREKLIIPACWVDIISDFYTLFTDMFHDIKVQFWDWPDHFTFADDLLNKMSGFGMDYDNAIIICPNIGLTKQFIDSCSGRYCVVEENMAFNMFRRKLIPPAAARLTKDIDSIVILASEIISPFKLYALLNTFVNSYLTSHSGQIVIVADLVCARRKPTDSTFVNYLPALFEKFRYNLNVTYEESSSFAGGDFDDTEARNNVSFGNIQVKVGYKLPDYAHRMYDEMNEERDKLVFFSKEFKNLHPSGKEIIISKLNGEWESAYKLGVEYKVQNFCIYHLVDTGETMVALGYGKGVFGCLAFAQPPKNEQRRGMYYKQKNAIIALDEGVDTNHFACCSIRTADVAIKTKSHADIVVSRTMMSSRTAYLKYSESRLGNTVIDVRPMYHITVPFTKMEPRLYTGGKRRRVCLIVPVIDDESYPLKLKREEVTLAVRYAFEQLDVVLMPFTRGKDGVLEFVDELDDSEAGSHINSSDTDIVHSWEWICNLFKQMGSMDQEEMEEAGEDATVENEVIASASESDGEKDVMEMDPEKELSPDLPSTIEELD